MRESSAFLWMRDALNERDNGRSAKEIRRGQHFEKRNRSTPPAQGRFRRTSASLERDRRGGGRARGRRSGSRATGAAFKGGRRRRDRGARAEDPRREPAGRAGPRGKG